MVSLLFNKIRPIALDIGTNSLKMIQLSSYPDNFRVLAVDERQIPMADNQDKNQVIVNTIKDMYSKGGFKGKDVITCLGNDQVQIKNFKIDALIDSKEAHEKIMKEAQSRFGLTDDIYDIDYIITGNTRQGDELKTEIILFFVKKSLIKEHINMIENAGLAPVGIDTVPCALYRCFLRNLRRQEDSEQITILIDIGNRFSTLIIGKGQELSFVKQIPIGGFQINDKVASKLDITVEEAGLMRTKLNNGETQDFDQSTRQIITDTVSSVINQLTREISLCFKYFTVTFKGIKPDKAFCTGGEAYEKLIIDSLHKSLNIEVEPARPLKDFNLGSSCFSNDRRRSWCEWTVPIGLSLKGLNTDLVESLTNERN